jgi:hypothetical protein
MVKFIFSQCLLVSLLLVTPIHISCRTQDSYLLPVNFVPGKAGLSLDKNLLPNTHGNPLLTFSNQLKQEPILLRYLIRLIGNDWLGANWVYLGLVPYRYPQLDTNGKQATRTNPVDGNQVPLWNSTRFWVDPGPALLKPGDTLWVWGFSSDAHTILADTIQVNPPGRVAAPIDVSASGYIRAVIGETITLQDASGIDYTIAVDAYTSYSFPPNEGLARPQRGKWWNISWLTGANGLLGIYDGYHGNYRGLLRFDFSKP